MGIVFIILAVIFEIVFAVFCIVSKRRNEKIRSFIRIGALVFFALLILVTLIKFSFRWWAFSLFLLILATIAVVKILSKKTDINQYKKGKIIVRAILMTVLVFVVLIPSLVFPQYKTIKTTGAMATETVKYTYIDENRIETYNEKNEKRKLNVEFWYPKGEKDNKYPLAVFSHGAFGIKTSNESLYLELASHGYIVCSIDHTYQSFFTKDAKGKIDLISRDYMKEVTTEDAKTDKQRSFELYKKWMDIRTGDINFVIDNIISFTQNQTEGVYKKITVDKIAVFGHSLGGSAALGIGRIRNDISAVLALESPFMCDITGVNSDGFIFVEEAYPVPVLNIYSDSSWSHLSEWAQYAQNYKLLSESTGKSFNVHIEGAFHIGLTDLSLSSPFLTRMLDGSKSKIKAKEVLKRINELTLNFFNCYLKDKGDFSQYIQS